MPHQNPNSPQPLADYELLLAVCGGIAAYKLCTVVSRLVQRGVGVTVAMTRAGRRFVGPTTFQALTGRQVFTSLWSADHCHDPQHLRLTERADLFLVAPATANIIGKMANGLADDLVSTMIIAADCPVMVAPAMNTRMWLNPIVQRNVSRLRELGYLFIDPTSGWMACGAVGLGRLAEPDVILDAVISQLQRNPPRQREQKTNN